MITVTFSVCINLEQVTKYQISSCEKKNQKMWRICLLSLMARGGKAIDQHQTSMMWPSQNFLLYDRNIIKMKVTEWKNNLRKYVNPPPLWGYIQHV